jgi:hypothetical protein
VVSSLISYIWIMVHAAFFLAFNISFELCLLGLASFLGPLLLWTFWRFYSKGGECETKASLRLKLTSGFKDMRPKGTKGGECEHKIKKGEV